MPSALMNIKEAENKDLVWGACFKTSSPLYKEVPCVKGLEKGFLFLETEVFPPLEQWEWFSSHVLTSKLGAKPTISSLVLILPLTYSTDSSDFLHLDFRTSPHMLLTRGLKTSMEWSGVLVLIRIIHEVLFKKYILFIFYRGEGREINIRVWLSLTCPPPPTPCAERGLQPSHVPWLGIKLATFTFSGWHSTTEPHQPGL